MTKIAIERIAQLRMAMKAAGVSATIIPQTDPHQGEYIASHWQVRRWLSGFTGSAGSLVVTESDALLWTDSRYFLQAAEQIEGTGIILMKEGIPGTPTIASYLCSKLVKNATVGINGMLFSVAETNSLRATLSKHGLKLDIDFDPIDKMWSDRPALPTEKIFVHDESLAGETAESKLNKVLAAASDQGADSVFISALDEIAWVLNIRSRDVKCNPVVTAYLYVGKDGSTLFVLPEKVDAEVKEYLAKYKVDIKPYDAVLQFLESLPDECRVMVEEPRTSAKALDALGKRAVAGPSPVAILKAVKNSVQIQGIRRSMELDGVALVEAFMEIERRMAAGEELTELQIADILTAARSRQPGYFDDSFETIAGYGPHGAIVHYSATPESSVRIEPHGLLLIDSGAQYLTGTTDITRTIAMGIPSDEEKRDFTLVMKGHIALATAIFPEGTRGGQLDALARQFLWANGLSYLHGTGHGVGHFLNVHEGPQSIRLNDVPATLTPGMLTSNEPGLYRSGVHGIRCENLVLTVEAFTTEFGRFYCFETMTLFPFDRSLFDLNIMTEQEINWVDGYHREVRDRLMPLLNDEQRRWLEAKTMPLKK